MEIEGTRNSMAAPRAMIATMIPAQPKAPRRAFDVLGVAPSDVLGRVPRIFPIERSHLGEGTPSVGADILPTVAIGHPQWGQVAARDDVSPLHSGHLVSAIGPPKRGACLSPQRRKELYIGSPPSAVRPVLAVASRTSTRSFRSTPSRSSPSSPQRSCSACPADCAGAR
jgi:hypothetical protein